MTPFDLSVRFFLQLAVILGVCRVVGAAGRRIGQPQVVGEMVAGVLLGPSLLGLVWPAAQQALFPVASMPILFSVCQIGLALYMFLVGLEFDVALVRRRRRGAAAVSAAGIAAPFTLGAAVAWWIAGDPALFAPSVTRLEAMLFMGAAMSVTAFPVLARIIHERGLAGTSLGTLALAAGALDDAAAWCILAVVLATFSGDRTIAASAIGGGVAYALVVLTVGRRALAALATPVERTGRLDAGTLSVVLMLVMLGAWITDTLRIYAVFGAFVLGVAMPRGRFAAEVQRTLGDTVTTLLLPLFFVYSGLNTRIGLLVEPGLLVLAVVVVAAATLGKFGACYAAARVAGEPPADAAGIGTLMNARGLMELIILNIGRERGLIEPGLFTVMVLMAIVTTLGATPLFAWIAAAARVGDATALRPTSTSL